MADNYGNAGLIKRLRAVIGQLDPRYVAGTPFYSYMALNGNVSQNSVRKAEKGEESCHLDSFEGMARGFSCKFLELYAKYPHATLFNALTTPDLGWLIERLECGDAMPIKTEDLIVNHEERYLIEKYAISLAVRPSIGKLAHIPRAGQPPEAFKYDDLARVTYDVTFSEDNRRTEPGFRLAYGTHNGRIKVLEPDEQRLVEDKAYRLQKRNAVFEPSPCVNASHRLRLVVFGGFGKDNQKNDEAAHFSMAQYAYYQNVSFTIDLSAYPDAALTEKPNLIVIPVLKGTKFDCCEIARKGQGLPVEPVIAQIGEWRWSFTELMNVMIHVSWTIDHSQIGEAGTPTEDQIIEFFEK